MKILVTGANGFVGKNLVCELASQGFTDVFSYDIDTKHDLLDKYCKECDFVFHLAGVNRPQNQDDFMKGNFGFTDEMLTLLKKHNNHAPILITSSVQATLDNPYGKSKKAGEDLMFAYGKENNVKVFVYRLYNLFGKWCRPNYNSVTATFCYNVAHELPIEISNENTELSLCYIDDVVTEFINALRGNPTQNGKFMTVKAVYTVTLGKLAHLINSFSDSRATKEIADMSNPFVKKLYSTYLSYLPTDGFSYPLEMHKDERGSFTEFIRTINGGQVSVNISKPGITKGNHWHNTKNEKFLVVCGKGVIRFRDVNETQIYEYFVSGDKLEVVDIPTGYTHSIVNLGESEMITIMWVNEPFDREKPDTYFLEV